jgi:cyclophilin family peptidyl-prolyl cis-trans isomerase
MTLRPFLLSAVFALGCGASQAEQARIETNYGTILVDLDSVHAPVSVANFVRYAREGHYDGTTFYRVVPGFVIQAGSYEPNGNARPTHDAIALESGNGLRNTRGALAMARSANPASATAEFFIDLSDNATLDPMAGDAPNTTGYAVFGRVSEGMDIVDRISTVPVGGRSGPFPPDATPAAPVIITKVTITP